MGLSSFIFLWWAPKDIMCNVNNAQWPFKVSSGSSKVVDFGTDRKRLCGFLLVLNSNLGRILHSFGDTAAYRSKKCKIARSNPLQSQKSPSLEVTPCEFFDESYLARKWSHGAIRFRWWRNHDVSLFPFWYNIGCDKDRRIDTWLSQIPALCIASRGKTVLKSNLICCSLVYNCAVYLYFAQFAGMKWLRYTYQQHCCSCDIVLYSVIFILSAEWGTTGWPLNYITLHIS